MGVLLFVLKLLLWPIILLVQSFRIYVIGCFGTYFRRGLRGLLCGLCVCCNCTYKDKKFPRDAKSIGQYKGLNPQQIDEAIEWKRIEDICERAGHDGAKLFSGKIEPSDICQGSLGNCWLMSALACLANIEGAIEQVFLTKESTAYGRYRIRLWDGCKEKFETIVIDDWIPCDRKTGQPSFAKPNGDEAWVLLLEKAFAKFKGSYGALDGGFTMYGLECMTGNVVFKFAQSGSGQAIEWKRLEMVHMKDRTEDPKFRTAGDVLTNEEMFKYMHMYSRKKSVIGASSGSGEDTKDVDGIVQGHAYSVIQVKELEGFRLLQLRNPWGSFEWKGNWGDASPLWQQNPKVAKALDFSAEDDGMFWMEWKDFCKYFKDVDFCLRTTGWNDLTLDIHEECACIGPAWGCISGCAGYWFCCWGFKALFCSQKKQEFEKVKDGCCHC